MPSRQISRRGFVKGSLSALALAALPARFASAQTPVRFRPEWQEFRSSQNYASFIDALRMMRANNNVNDRSSLRFWSNVHVNSCPHGTPYFLAWHRGFLFLFEEQLRIVSGNGNLVIPYWDFYRNPNLPPEFTDPATNNPLYVPRVNTNFFNALTLTPFGPTVWNFERGRPNAFEPLMESAPHNPIHDLMGGIMGTMEAPMDPIFYLHHANVDRLWHAWALPDGKGIPWLTSAYWSGNLNYAPNLTLPRSQCYHPNRVGSDYADVTPPSSLPPQANAARFVRVQAQAGNGMLLYRPRIGDFPLIGPRAIGVGKRAVGGARSVVLSAEPISVYVPVEAADARVLQAIAAKAGSTGATQEVQYKSMQIVFDDVKLLKEGKTGGYFYNVYLNLPAGGVATIAKERHLLGTVGPFEIKSAMHHGNTASLVFPATEVLTNIGAEDLSALTVSVVRVSGPNSPRGRTISIGEVRAELSTEDPYNTDPHVVKPQSVPYR